MGRVLYNNKEVADKSSGTVTKAKRSFGLFANPFAMVVLLLGTLAFLSGSVWLTVAKVHQYEPAVGSAKMANVQVSGVTKQTDEESFENAVAQIDKYHLTTVYEDGFGKHDVVLEESYIDEELAQSKIGEKRFVKIDSATYTQLHNNGMAMWFAIPLSIGLIIYLIMGIRYLRKVKA